MGAAKRRKKMTVGRERKWDNEEDLKNSIEAYFSLFTGAEVENHPKHNRTPNLFGICRHLKISYDAFLDYESGKYDEKDQRYSQLSVPAKEARIRCLEFANERILSNSKGAAFVITNLTQKFREPWKNSQSNEHTGPGGERLFEGIKIEWAKGSDAPPEANTPTT